MLTVDIHSQLKDLDEFLDCHKYLWQPKMLAGYPDPLRNIPESWVTFYRNSSIDQLCDLSVFKSTGKDLLCDMPDSLRQLVENLFQLCDLPRANISSDLIEEDDIYKKQILKLSVKKAHEFSLLGPYIKEHLDRLKIKNFIDVGGGKGFLSLAVSSCTCRQILIDQNRNLLNKGKGYFKRWKRSKDLECHEIFIDSDLFLDNFMLTEKSLIAGLHLCGDLSVYQISAASKNKDVNLINFGCCYHRISASNLNLSGMCRHILRPTDLRLALSPFAYKSMDTFSNNQIKNHYRYALYCLYQYFFNEVPAKSFLNKFDYPVIAKVADFSEFIDINLNNFNCFNPMNRVMKVYEDKISELASEMEIFEFFRRLFSRAIELYIILDRAKYIENKGLSTEVLQFFDGRVSPRNIGIVALNL
ncbi:MAG: hypothetical protein COA79_19425 [Planctomycetota bacterium]|nr:MAG: hypothetical protein COA79_19425 [Planctomycetota bacterium]